MADGVKSTLVLGQPNKKETEKTAADNADIEYKQVAHLDDFIGELSDEEKETEFHKQHD